MLRYTTDRARPGLVALYDIRPGNGVGQFLQPRSPHGVYELWGHQWKWPPQEHVADAVIWSMSKLDNNKCISTR